MSCPLRALLCRQCAVSLAFSFESSAQLMKNTFKPNALKMQRTFVSGNEQNTGFCFGAVSDGDSVHFQKQLPGNQQKADVGFCSCGHKLELFKDLSLFRFNRGYQLVTEVCTHIYFCFFSGRAHLLSRRITGKCRDLTSTSLA